MTKGGKADWEYIIKRVQAKCFAMAGVQNDIADLIDDEAECSNNGSSERDSFSEDERDKYFINDEDSFSTESYNHRSYEHMDEMHGEKYGHTYLESVLDNCENGEINKMYGASGLEESKKFNANAFTNGIVYPEPKPSRKLKDTQCVENYLFKANRFCNSNESR